MHTFFNTTIRQLLCALALIAGSAVSAQAQTTSENTLYLGLGEKAGIDKIVADFIPLILADQRINQFFSKLDKAQFAALLADQFCELAGGPCKYQGRDMYTTHDGMGISNAHFNALAEDLQIAMEKNNIASSVSNKLVAKLAPMQRPIVSK
ncbi:group I truncated hemoglobin [Undibacterium parvum]|uniref:Group 1 truncated hemoglobin n=1 Tax=Undibacterium parvum TaxID=401471 RepID=A0A3S9HMI5_9BURK|nr:group 1 truncated hemoglobin [Undibacterium parvum]AZP13316.1 group 1 truncated hemoglobin [Undibacterium parvum]